MDTFVKHISSSNQITVFWGYEHYSLNTEYCFYINDVCVGKSTHTHFTFNELTPNTTYEVKILANEKPFATTLLKTSTKKDKVVVNVNSTGDVLVTKELQNIIDNNIDKIICFPKGTYLSGALFLHENSHLYFEKGACLLGSTEPKEYLPKIPSRFEGLEMECYASLINAISVNNIIIEGEGEIKGGGAILGDKIIEAELPYVDESTLDLKKTNPSLIAGRKRNRLINITRANNVLIKGLKMGYASSWNLHVLYSENVVITNCLFESFGVHNGDGIDPDSSKNIYIFDNTFNSGDDCIAIKSGKNPEGNIINIPTENVEIFDCKTIRGHGCAIGSEVSGGIKNVNIFDSDFTNTIYGLHIKTTKKRGGFVKNVNVDNVSFPSINIRMVPYNDDGESSGQLTEFKDFNFSNISLSGIMYEDVDKTDNVKYAIEVNGFEDDKTKFSNFTFTNLTFYSSFKDDKILIANANNIQIRRKN
ncbi:MAG: glycosyl hydrolase family 28 protein [Bacilli bacterium]|nr:glycosyl hydrolase family 28 protein [Bacilli bacterium]